MQSNNIMIYVYFSSLWNIIFYVSQIGMESASSFQPKEKGKTRVVDCGWKMKILRLLKHLKSCATLDINVLMIHLN